MKRTEIISFIEQHTLHVRVYSFTLSRNWHFTYMYRNGSSPQYL